MDLDGEQENVPYEETLEAAKMLEEIGESLGKQASSEEKLAEKSSEGLVEAGEKSDELGAASAPPGTVEGAETAKRSTGSEEASPGEKGERGEPSIGELFSNLVKMSPPEKIRLEEGSIGSLFKKFIGKRG